MADEKLTGFGRPKRLASVRRFFNNSVYAKQEIRKKLKRVSNILKKHEADRTDDEKSTLHQLPDVVKTAEKNAKRQLKLKERVLEIEDQPDVLDRKCQELAQLLETAKNAIVYTGAGISTAASIPDYRGPNGVWTLLKKGQSLRAQDLVDAEPTYTHMCIAKLFKEGKVKYLVSQNCDGLHIRSGFPRHSLSEVHGNMFIEMCKYCKPQKEFLRLFDVTERTAKGRHKTGRTCSKCGNGLCDSIVHFGEKGGLKSPYKWKQAAKAASKSDLIVCIGSSLKVLRCYPCLWRMDIRPEQRPKLVIINLQWTPKDDRSVLKIHGRCDDVLRRVANHLGINVPEYRRETDPLFRLHAPVKPEERRIASKKSLEMFSKRSVKQTMSKRKLCHRAADYSLSGQQQHKILKTDICQSSNNENCDYLGSSTLCAQTEEINSRLGDQILKTEQTHANSKIGHILRPVRLKLEEMLKNRGLGNNMLHISHNGKERVDNSKTSSSQSPALSPLPGIQNFLPLGVGNTSVPWLSHPQLRRLLSSTSSQPQSQEQDVFRVDLSTNPISITSNHCSAKHSSDESSSVILTKVPTAVARTATCSSNSSYAKLLQRIQFEHSYSRNLHKSRRSGKGQDIVRDRFPYLTDSTFMQHVSGSNRLSEQSVINVCSDTSDLNIAHQSMNFVLTNPNILSAARQVVDYLPESFSLQTNHCHRRNFDSSSTQEKVIVNLNSSLRPYLSSVQLHSALIMLTTEESLATCSLNDFPGKLEADDENGEYENCSENVKFFVGKKEAVSIPGWFGKGMRVRRKRSM